MLAPAVIDRVRGATLALLLVAASLTGCGGDDASAPTTKTTLPAGPPKFVGTARCVSCHEAAVKAWRGSDHDLAMQDATEATVLGDFGGARLEHFGVTSTFLRRDGAFVVHTDGPDGTLADYEIAYTFGVHPLQQYLVRFPDGRLRALGLAWDSRPANEGGQRWFHLQPDEAVPHGDVLHWTGPAGDWALQCGECHSTDLDTGYDAETDHYTPTWIDVNVGCEACHGPGSRHVGWAEDSGRDHDGDDGLTVRFGKPGAWEFASGAAIAHRVPPRTDHQEVETCAPCHARRALIVPGADAQVPFLDAHRPALLDAGLYFADGQMDDEVYVWGSFLQSKMYAAGVTCSDCHDPHSLKVAGDDACAKCHQPDVFATPAHTHHPAGSAGASCIACHMPSRTYMVVDARHDHAFRIPRPDLSVALGLPNACTDCHTTDDAQWAADAVASWGGTRPKQPHFALTIDAGRRRLPGAGARLAALAGDPSQPAIVRATAVTLLGEQLDAGTVEALRPAIGDPDPLVRMAAAGASEALPPEMRIALVRPLLGDPVRAVRDEAARVLSSVPDDAWGTAPRADFDTALHERLDGLRSQADRPDAHVALGVLHAQRGERDAALREYETARQLAPYFVPATVNLADLARADDRNDEAERVLREGLGVVPDSADLHHALGLTLVRLGGRSPEALEELGKAAGLAPDNVRYAYVYAVALGDTGHKKTALEELRRAHERFPGDVDVLIALVTMSRDAGNLDDARRYARTLAQVAPSLPGVNELLQSLGGTP